MKRISIIAAVLASSAFASLALAQVKTGGLDALSDDSLMAELASRDLSSLLDRAFDVNKVAPEKRDGIKTLSALHRLNDPKLKLTNKERQQLISDSVKGIEQALPKLNDPVVLMQQAVTLIQSGVEHDVNTLEYWGENPRTQGQLRPVVEAVTKILDKASETAATEADKLSNQIKSPNDTTAQAKWEKMDGLAGSAKYTRHMVDYYVALSMDKGDPKRKEIAEGGITFLTEFDNNDSQVRPLVRNRIAKLNMAKGDYEAAKKLFTSVAEGKDDAGEILPKPDAYQQYEARYFAVVCDLLAKKFDDAQKGLESVQAWEKTNLPNNKAAQDGADAAARMMQYRILQGQADAQTDAAQKKAMNDKAVAVLQQLAKDRPELQSVINEQLINTLPENAPLATMDPLLLQAIVSKGEAQLRADLEKPDTKLIDRAIEASRELIKRKGTDKSAAEAAENGALLIPFFLQREGKTNEAADAFLDYVDAYKDQKESATNLKLALDNATALIAQMKKTAADDPATVKLYDRFLPIAINKPFNRKEFAYEYARLLQRTGKYAEAVQYFQMVPQDDKRVLMARYYQMVAQKQLLDDDKTKVEGAARTAMVDSTVKLADQVTQLAGAAMNAAPTEDEKRNFRSMQVRASLLQADIARREQKDPAKVLAALEGFEAKIKGLPNEKELLSEALIQRVNGYMAVGQNVKATEALKQQLDIAEGQQGLAMVYGLLDKLNQDLEKARTANDKTQIRVLAKNRADLSGFLVDWAEKNTNPDVKKYVNNYRAFDADTKHLAADLEEDPTKQKEMYKQTLALYQKLEAEDPSPYVLFGEATIYFELGDCKEVLKRLSPLLDQRKLGAPKRIVKENGEDKEIDNSQYWEALYKLMRCNVDLAKSGGAEYQANLDETKRQLKKNYIQWGKQVGGAKWHEQFETLRKEIVPDFDPDKLVAPTSEPVAAQ